MEPAHLFIAAAPEPRVSNPPLEEMLRSVVEGGGQVDMDMLRRFNLVPEALLKHPEMVRMLLPTLQADFKLLYGYVYQPDAPFTHPLTALAGTKDVLAGREHLEPWSQHTLGGFKLRLMEGEHLFVRTDPAAVQVAIVEDLAGRFQSG